MALPVRVKFAIYVIILVYCLFIRVVIPMISCIILGFWMHTLMAVLCSEE